MTPDKHSMVITILDCASASGAYDLSPALYATSYTTEEAIAIQVG